jgi:putative membrane protein
MPDEPKPGEPVNDPRVYFAAERTLLAWLRTGLALMGVGFAVARFGLFLREMQAKPTQTPAAHATGASLWSGVALVLLGVFVEIAATARHLELIRQLREGTWQPGHISRTAVALGSVLGLVGIAIAVYLVVR